MSVRYRNLVFILVMGLVLIGCTGRTTLKRGWVETSGFSHLNVRYNYFDGIESRSFRAGEGEDIDLQAEVDVEEGTLTIRLLDPNGDSIWEESTSEDAQFSLSVEAERKGRYKLVMEGETAEGGFELDWEIKD